MDNYELRKTTISELMQLSTVKGYITFDDILDLVTQRNLPIDDTERISGQLLSNGCIIRENDNTHTTDDSIMFDARGYSDYSEIYGRVLELDEALVCYVEFLKNVAPFANAEFKSIIHQAQDGNNYARNRIISVYMKSVLRIALWASEKYDLPISDAIQNGNLGLLTAFEKYDAVTGGSFVSYASMWVRQYILRAANIAHSVINYPEHIKSKLFIIYDWLKTNGDDFNINNVYMSLSNEMTGILDVSMNEINDLLGYLTPHICLEEYIDDEQIFSDDGTFESDMLKNYLYFQMRVTINEAVLKLGAKEQKVLRLRFGLTCDEPHTLEEVGVILGVTRERVRQIEAKALRKLRQQKNIDWLKSFW